MALPLLAIGKMAAPLAPVAAGWVKDKFAGDDEKKNNLQTQSMSFGQVNQTTQASSEQSGFMGAMAKFGPGLSGAAAGVGLAVNDFDDNQSLSSKARDVVGKGLVGAGAGMFTKLANDAIQEDGGSLKASAFSAIAGGLGSYLKDGGPGALQSAAIGAGAGFTADKVHDGLSESGHEALGDSLSGAVQGGALGGTTLGSGTGVAVGGAAGGLAGLAQNYFSGNNGGENTGLTSGFSGNQISADVPQFASMGQAQHFELPQETSATEQSYDRGYEA